MKTLEILSSVPEKKLSTPIADLTIRADGILHIHVKVEEEFNIDHCMSVVEARRKLADGKAYPLVFTSNEYVAPTPEAREYAASEDRSDMILSDAYVITSSFQRVIANVYMRLNKPLRPTRFFNNLEDAIKWSRKFVKSSDFI